MPRTVAIIAALSIGAMLVCMSAQAGNGQTVAVMRTLSHPITAYAEVTPKATLALRARIAGRVRNLRTLPGDPVAAGQILLRLVGAQTESELAPARAKVRQERAALELAEQSAIVEKNKLAAHLGTREGLLRARTEGVRARAALASAEATLAAIEQTTVLRAPKAGTLTEVLTGDGDPVVQGQTLMRLLPRHGLWLVAACYGSAIKTITPGMTGRFQPADDGPAIPVRVRSLIGPNRAGGLRVGLLPAAGPPGWRNGEVGTLTLNGPVESLPAVPSKALILDQGSWWVLIRTPSGLQRRAVVPGLSVDGWTQISKGLKAGARVVTDNAYAIFHRDFARSYQQPD